MLMDMCLSKFDIYHGTVTPVCFKSHRNSWCPDFFSKKKICLSGLKFTLFEVTSFLPDNFSKLKKNYIEACSLLFPEKQGTLCSKQT